MDTNDDKILPALTCSESGEAECSRTKTDEFISLLDAVDVGVEKCRGKAIELEEELETLTFSLDVIASDIQFKEISEDHQQELDCYINRITKRLQSVELKVSTTRSPCQIEALYSVNYCIGKMIEMKNPLASLQCCQLYLNSCSSAVQPEVVSSPGNVELDLQSVDKTFENSLLGCTLDDQKRIRKRLGNLKRYITEKMTAQLDI